MMTPLKRHIENLRSRLPWSKIMTRLKPSDLAIIENLYTTTADDDPHDRQLKINRLFIDQRDAKPKRWKEILEIAQTINGREVRAIDAQ